MTETQEIKRIAVVGTGVIGQGWLAYFLAQGFEVSAYDPNPNAAQQFKNFVAKAWPSLIELGVTVTEHPGKARFHQSIGDAVDGAQFVQENVPEILKLKQDVLSEIDSKTDDNVIIASSTSSLLTSDLQATCAGAHRVVSGHPYNPVYLIPLVEVSGGNRTADEALQQAMAFYESIGKRPIRLNKEISGHIAGRLGAALWKEAVHIAAEGIASVADIDAAVAYGPGLRWACSGPHLTYHLAGGDQGYEYFLDHLGPSQEKRWAELGAPKLTEPVKRLLIEGIGEEIQDHTYDDLTQIRDRRLLGLLNTLKPRTQ